jgi:hypothetical protein
MSGEFSPIEDRRNRLDKERRQEKRIAKAFEKNI